ncbi:MAG: hypothetical protein ABIP75_13885 [Pyrinomonadaceae bacterium]
MFKYLAIALLAFSCLTLAGCQKDAEVGKFITDLDAMSKDVVKAVDDSPNEAGVDAAQKIFDAKKGDIKSQLDALKTARASTEMTEKLTTSVKNNVTAVLGLQSKYIQESMNNPGFKEKLDKLGKDYVDMLKMQ